MRGGHVVWQMISNLTSSTYHFDLDLGALEENSRCGVTFCTYRDRDAGSLAAKATLRANCRMGGDMSVGGRKTNSERTGNVLYISNALPSLTY